MGSQNVVSWRVRTKMRLIEYKGGACIRCGYNKPIPRAYDFHHRDSDQKDFSISGKSKNFDILKKEADKCDLLCRRCHAEVHHEIDEKRRLEKGTPYLQMVLICANPECKKPFNRNNWTQIYCTKECYHKIYKIRCGSCRKIIINPQSDQKYCSHECMHLGRRKVERPSKEKLIELLKNSNTNAVGKIFGVSHGAVKKWCKSYEIQL